MKSADFIKIADKYGLWSHHGKEGIRGIVRGAVETNIRKGDYDSAARTAQAHRYLKELSVE